MIRVGTCTLLLLSFTALIAQIPVEKKESTSFVYYYEKGDELLIQKKYEEAIVYFNECLNLYPYHEEAYYSRALAKENLNDYDGALSDYNIYLEMKPNQGEALFARAMLHYNQRRWSMAWQDLVQLLIADHGETNRIIFRQNPYTGVANHLFTTQGSGKAYIFNYLALTETELGEYSSALIHFDSAIAHNPLDADYYVNKGKCFERLNQPDEARNNYLTALELQPGHTVAQHNLSVLNRSKGNTKEADKLLEEVIAKNPDLPYPYAERAYQEISRGEFRKALTDLNTAIKLEPGNAEYYLDRGIAKESLRDWNGAHADYTQAIKLDDKLEKAWFSRANLLYRLTRYGEAIDDYSIAIYLHEEYAQAYYNRALTYRKVNRNTEACADLKIAALLSMKVSPKLLDSTCSSQQ